MHWWSRPQSARGIPAPAHCVWTWAAPGWAALPLPALNCLLWQNAIACTGGQAGLDPDRLIFIDESGLSTKMARLRGWAPKGERCLAAIPHGLWKTITFAGGLTLSGFVAPMLLDGPMDGECFRAWVDRGQGRHTPLPAAIQPRLQPHRNRLRQAQGPCPQSRRAKFQRARTSRRARPHKVRPEPMHQLPRSRRVRLGLTGIRSRSKKP